MPYPKTFVPVSYPVAAFLERPVDVASVAANSTLTVEIAAPKAFQHGRPVLIQQKLGETPTNAGLSYGLGQVVENSGKKIRFRVENHTVAAIDPPSTVLQFLQL